MKLDLSQLVWLFESLDKEDLEQQNITDFNDFLDYIIRTIIDNLEYDFDIDFNSYVDLNNFICD